MAGTVRLQRGANSFAYDDHGFDRRLDVFSRLVRSLGAFFQLTRQFHQVRRPKVTAAAFDRVRPRRNPRAVSLTHVHTNLTDAFAQISQEHFDDFREKLSTHLVAFGELRECPHVDRGSALALIAHTV